MIRRIAPWLGLLAASILLWQLRFVAMPHDLNGDAGFGQGMEGWITEGGPDGLRTEDGVTVAHFARPVRDGELRSAGRWLGGLDGVRYLHVEVEAKWSEVVPGRAAWARPRLVLVTRDPDGTIRFPLDHGAYLAYGSRDWHREEVVFELTPEMHDVGLVFQMLGTEGRMEARRFQLTALRSRPWVPAATVLLIAGWVLWVGRQLRGPESKVAWWRALPTAAVVVACSWYVVFPGPRMQSRPLLGTFVTGGAEAPPPAVAATDATPSVSEPAAVPSTGTPAGSLPAPGDQPGPATTAPAHPGAADRLPPMPDTTAPPPEPRSQPVITEAIRKLDPKINMIHLAAFFALGIGVFLATGTLAPWRLLAVIAVLSEAVPTWQNRRTDAGDLLDLTTNLLGIALAAGTFLLLARLTSNWSRFLPGRRAVPGGPDAALDHPDQ